MRMELEQLEAAKKIEELGLRMRDYREDGDIVSYIQCVQEIGRINKELWGPEGFNG